jgi:hypothetical protein
MKINIVKNDPIFHNIDTLFGCMIFFEKKNQSETKIFCKLFCEKWIQQVPENFDTLPTIVKTCATCLMLFQVAL